MMLCCYVIVIAITMLLACYVMLCYWPAAEGGTRWSGFLSADNLSYKQYKKDIMLYGNIFVFQLLLLLVPPSPPLILPPSLVLSGHARHCWVALEPANTK